MAFEIIQPDVGTRLLRTFSTLSEENRKRQELASNIQLREQRVLQQTLMNDIRERQLGISQQRADTSLALGNANLKLRQQTEERLAQSAATDMALDQQKIDATNSDAETQRAVVGLMNTPDENGLTLSQRLNSDNPQVARDAMNAFAEIQRRYSGSGKLTDKYLNDSFSILGKNRQDELARIREERMASTAVGSADRAERSLAERERHNRVTEGASASKVQSSMTAEQTRNRLRALNQEIPSETMQYEKRMAEYNKAKDPARKSQLETEIRILGETIDKKKAERDRLTRIPAGPQPDQLFGGQAELPPVPDNAAAPIPPAPARPSIQAVPNTTPESPKSALGFPVREKLYPVEESFFKANPNVSGMAADDDSVILNPYSPSNVNKDAVVRNEAYRLWLRKNNITPEFEITPEQRSAFQGTAYENDEQALKSTIAARIFSGDPSARATPQQIAWVRSKSPNGSASPVAPTPTPADVNGLDFIFARPAR